MSSGLTPPINCQDKSTVTALYEQLWPLAINKVLYLLNDEALAQDVVHDVFETMWRAEMKFADVKSAYQWIYVSCHNAAIDHLRKHKRRDALLSSVSAVLFTAPKTPQDRLANRQLLTKLVHLLNERETIVLAYLAIDGLTQKRIASILEVSDKTIQRVVSTLESKIKPMRGVFYE